MSKKLLALVLSIMLLVTVSIVGAAATETPAPETHTHCVCGGAPTAAAANHSCESIEWTPISDALAAVGLSANNVNFSKLPSGNYYLDSNLTVASGAGPSNANLKICLNGHNITAPASTDTSVSANSIFGYGVKNATITLTDCSYNATAKTWGGTVYGGAYKYGGIIYTGPKTTINIYGGNYTAKDATINHTNGGLFVVGQDAENTVEASKAVMNIYNGKLYGAKASSGGLITLFHYCDLNVYGGVLSDGTAGRGGLINSSSSGDVNIYGGTLKNGIVSGTSPYMGGAIAISKGTLNVKGGTFYGNAAYYGGAIYVGPQTAGSTAVANIEGGVFNVGTTYTAAAANRAYSFGGNIYIDGTTGSASMNIKPGADIRYGYTTNAADGKGGNIAVKNATVTMTGGTVAAGYSCHGGNFFFEGTTATVYELTLSGGTISGGRAVHTGYPTAKNGTALIYPGGGNINVSGNEKLVVNGATIEDGVASHCGGNIAVNGSADLDVISGKVKGGSAAYAANIHTNNSADVVVTIKGGEITGGTLDKSKVTGNGPCIRLQVNTKLILEGTPKVDEIFFVGNTVIDAKKLEALETPITIVPSVAPTTFAEVTKNVSGSFAYAGGSVGYAAGAADDDSLDVPVDGGEGSVDIEIAPARRELYLIGAVEGETFSSKLAAGAYAYYSIIGGAEATVTIENADAYIVYDGVTYVADENGVVEVVLGDEENPEVKIGNAATGEKTFSVAIEIPVKQDQFTVAFARLNLDNEINMQFAFSKNTDEDITGAYAEVVKDYVGYESVTQTIEAKDWMAVDIDGVTHYVVSFSGIAAKEMGDAIHVTVYNAQGEVVSNVWNDSIKAYITRNINSVTDKERKLYVDMLYYGAAAQTFFAYDAQNLVINELTDEQKALASTSVVTENNQVPGDNFLGTRLTLVSRIELQMAFRNIDNTMRAEYSFVDHYGTQVNATVPGSEFLYEDGVWIVTVNKQVLADAREEVTVKVYNAEDEEVASVTDSVESYVNRNATNSSISDSEKDLHQKVMRFANSAYEFFHS